MKTPHPTKSRPVLKSPPVFHVVGVAANGDCSVVSTNASREAADSVVRLIRNSGRYRKLKIEAEEQEVAPCRTK
jgi:hypothetical protein